MLSCQNVAELNEINYIKANALQANALQEGVVTPISTILRAMTRIVTTYLANVSVAWAQLTTFLSTL